MAGIGVTFSSKEPQDSPSMPLANLPPKVVDEIVRVLGVTKADEVRQSLKAERLDTSEGAEIAIERVSTKETLTVKKVPGSSEFAVTFGNTTVNIAP
jgi:hypothetical protein